MFTVQLAQAARYRYASSIYNGTQWINEIFSLEIMTKKNIAFYVKVGNPGILDIEINYWSWSFVNIQTNLIIIGYALKSVVCGKWKANQRIKKLQISKIKRLSIKCKSANFGYRYQAIEIMSIHYISSQFWLDYEYPTHQFPALIGLLEVELKHIYFTLNLRALDPVLRAPAFKLLIPSSTFPDWYGLYLGGWFGAEYTLFEGAASRIRIPNNVPEYQQYFFYPLNHKISKYKVWVFATNSEF